ncbi:DNA repair protein RecN [Clostridium estertheticum]|uniref:DNA repair protein RecN n=1 Tax=Clostridium estertheticum subsp. estertheticum TaxID=1552 RepID=A0A1J0GI50_9CLOT|nr:DNA repair protein RecN [Clostridium estertheticum]APC41005.1 DNA repair protein RecN [Clostridium estertheticum subsp. estertheticum]MBU3074069.1 DNA repair protein RecN [Clostridium estertheticum]MBU3164163.1 DNA repair protein RecN [Clostridium estertheticum]MBU3170099.1 DNA repair protein RecN [Clostridium estertheticum]MBZ9617124.1 DNA repair protein RecN [Clostridium estertheticum subsp. laramiense]
MLLQLNIMNFALIEKLSINFERGFNVLSGETGAGKSILIDAINYVLGGKFNKSLIRTGENKTYVEAIFTIDNQNNRDVLEEMDIDYEDTVFISRETFQSGKSIAKVNGKSLLLSKVKYISKNLLDIHGQHDNHNLLDKANHIFYVDSFGNERLRTAIIEYNDQYTRMISIKNRIIKLEGNEGERDKRIDFLNYQLEEIKNANLKIGEDEELLEKYAIVSNSENLEKHLSISYQLLYTSDEENPSVLYNLAIAIKELRTIEKHMDKIKEIADSIEESYFNIEESITEIRDLKESIYYDEKELEYMNSRISQINNCKKKYGSTIKEIYEYRDKIDVEYEELTNSSEIITSLKKEKIALEGEMRIIADEIHEIRCETAKKLQNKIKDELNYIGLEKSKFFIEVKLTDEFYKNGCDKVQFCIATNPGEPLNPLEEIVSGGELSRIMLALKTVFVDKDEIPTVIFDEIDTGISGRIAQCVAEKMYIISLNHQIFCVTHLPQIASMADINYLISKNVINDKTYTNIIRMNDNEKQQEIARMIGGTEVTKLTLENSKEMINLANNRKKK